MLEETLRRGLEAMRLPCSDEQSATKHFLDSAAPLMKFSLAGKCVVDVGSGAGFPGLPLRILEPGMRLTLLDAQQKRVGFLSEACAALGFGDVQCVHARAEEITAMREQFNFALARAVARLSVPRAEGPRRHGGAGRGAARGGLARRRGRGSL